MPSATIDKLNQLKVQLEQCNNETAALLLKRTIAKLESQLQIEQLTTGSAKAPSKEIPKASQANTKRQPTDQDQAKGNPKTTPQQQQATTTPQAKSKQRKQRNKRQPLLSGNGTHRAWCRLPGIIRAQEVEGEKERPNYFLELDGHQIPLRVKHRFAKFTKAALDRPLMVKCYPQIIDGQILFTQFAGAIEVTPEKPEAWVLIGVWNAHKQRVLVQRDQKVDNNRRILQHSPLISEECLEKLEDRKLYRFECQRKGVTVTVVGVEAVMSEAEKSDQVIS
ncbi:hypothetical protein HRE53_29790 (plasmid) [Acaryochloris sp. 'Moss Beach']|uniref:hypothetical protein n=1 Tax=Acaryochloris sp. 'Moss Beach' TaxID=2740837 RepID=UPI001F350C76|nr:hypothetical protein [Acaryochloris sp. 'Moss Beach']UJB72797.1 hypothetical protein HRE53_29790 [Acaryochloris sp. 'Moss Beach']